MNIKRLLTRSYYYTIVKSRITGQSGYSSKKGGNRMAIIEVFGLIVLIIAVIDLVVKITGKKK